ncbi:MAG: hypothetical protein U0936_03810 [Planctomycetaceae bacterium]
MTSDSSELDPADERDLWTQSETEPSELIEELPVTEFPYLGTSKMELDPLELGGPDDFRDQVSKIDSGFEEFGFHDDVVRPMEFLETPEGYTSPHFDDSSSQPDVDHDLDALFEGLAETASGQSADIAVWCPWLINASHN